MCDEITYPFPQINGFSVDVRKCVSNFIPHFIIHVITYSCWAGHCSDGPVKCRLPEHYGAQHRHYLGWLGFIQCLRAAGQGLWYNVWRALVGWEHILSDPWSGYHVLGNESQPFTRPAQEAIIAEAVALQEPKYMCLLYKLHLICTIYVLLLYSCTV